jgi:predicted DNA-binding transcriptional regulator AlpA
MPQKQLDSSVKRLIRIDQVMARLSMSRSSVWEGCRAGRLPQPFKIGPPTTVWKSEDIDAFIDSLGTKEAGNE